MSASPQGATASPCQHSGCRRPLVVLGPYPSIGRIAKRAEPRAGGKTGIMRCRTGTDHYLHDVHRGWSSLWCGRGAPCGGVSERHPSRAQGHVQLEMCAPNRLWVTCPCCRATGPRVDPCCRPAHISCGTGRPPWARTLGVAGRHAGRWRRALCPVASHPRIMRAPALLAQG